GVHAESPGGVRARRRRAGRADGAAVPELDESTGGIMAGNLKAELPPTLQPGEPAPDFTLPAIHKDGILSLAQYRRQTPGLLAVFRGLYCPFCRRGLAQLGMTAEKLKGGGVDTLPVV